jgi:hypothetical protein
MDSKEVELVAGIILDGVPAFRTTDADRVVARKIAQRILKALSKGKEGRGEALRDVTAAMAIDRAFIDGAKAGYNFGLTEDHEGLESFLSIRRAEISAAAMTARELKIPNP